MQVIVPKGFRRVAETQSNPTPHTVCTVFADDEGKVFLVLKSEIEDREWGFGPIPFSFLHLVLHTLSDVAQMKGNFRWLE